MKSGSVLPESEVVNQDRPAEIDGASGSSESPFTRTQRQTTMSTVPDSLSQLVEMGLLTEDDLSICGEIDNPEDLSIDSLVNKLVERRRLTKYQADVICNRRPGMLVMGEYTILERLGAGGMGVVYKAYHRRMHREVAVKVLLESGVQSEDKIERFRREAIAAARMNHPNIVTAYDANEHEGIPYLVMEYVKGRDLGSLVKKGDKLSVPEAVNYILQTARGMEYAHSRHIIHRDLKPSNLLLASPDDSDIRPGQFARVKILDMGLARLTQPSGEVVSPALEGSDLSATGMLMGTVDYMAPEQAMDTKRADHRSDIYSLGCTLYFLLTKKPVYSGANLLERISAHLKAEIPSLRDARPEVPEELDAIFKKMVAKEPADRYQSMTEVIEALQKVDRQLSGPDTEYIWRQGDFSHSDVIHQPGSSAGGSRSGSGSHGSAPTIASGSGPVPGMPGSSFGSTLYDEGVSGSRTITVPTGMPLSQKLIIVMLLGLMAGALVAIVVKYKPAETEVVVEPPPPPPPPPAPYLPPYAVTLDESRIVEVQDQGNTIRYYDLIAVDLEKLVPHFPGPAVAEKPVPEGSPAIAEKPPMSPLVRFRLIEPGPDSTDRPFYMMENKVWNDLFRVFAQAQPDKLDPDTEWTDAAEGRLPAFDVNVMEAYGFARWMGGKLPSTDQWDIAAGFHLAEEDRGEGPFLQAEEGEPNVAVHGNPMPVDDPTDDISPFGIRHMAGNGREFTRSTRGSGELTEDHEVVFLGNAPFLRSRSFDYIPPRPLDYFDMEKNNRDSEDSHWDQQNTADEITTFRVVLEIPKVVKTNNKAEEAGK